MEWITEYGSLTLSNDLNILIEGNSAEIVRTGFSSRNAGERFHGTEMFTEDYPLDTHRLTDTYSGKQDYAVGYVQFSSYNDKRSGDIIFRFMDENDEEMVVESPCLEKHSWCHVSLLENNGRLQSILFVNR